MGGGRESWVVGFTRQPDAMEETVTGDGPSLLLDHFGRVGDPREAAKVEYPLREVLFPVACATIAGCADYDEIARDVAASARMSLGCRATGALLGAPN